MPHTFHNYLAFMAADADAGLTALQSKLQNFYAKTNANPVFKLIGQQLTMTIDHYSFFIHFSDAEHVQEEAIEIAAEEETDWADKRYDKKQLATCTKRFEISAEEDYDMRYFTDCENILECLQTFKGLFIFYM
jgi:hypothetical protein